MAAHSANVSTWQSVDGAQGLGAPALFAMMTLHGVYLILFIIAFWSTFQYSSPLMFRLRIAASVMFAVVTIHSGLKLTFFFVDVPQDRNTASVAFIFPNCLAHIIPCIAGGLSDGLLAWRCFVLWGRSRWLKYFLAFVILADAFMGTASNYFYGHYLSILLSHDVGSTGQLASMEAKATTLLLAWVWMFFAINSLMTGSILWKIIFLAYKNKEVGFANPSGVGYGIVIRAIVESSLISWLGLLMFGITSLFTRTNLGFETFDGQVSVGVLASLPCIFGISQCLMIARIGLARLLHPSSSISSSGHELTTRGQHHYFTNADIALTVKPGREDVSRSESPLEDVVLDAVVDTA